MRKIAFSIQRTCDEAFAHLYRPLIWLILALMVLFTGMKAYELSRSWDEWSVADWLVSYAAGFVRRGLGGELILFTSAVSGVPANIVVFGVVFTLFGAVCALFAHLLRGRLITFWFFVLCLSPGFLLFSFYDPFAVGRKELLLYVAFLGWTVMLTRHPHPSFRAQGAFALGCVLITLVHELFVFYSLYFVVLALLMGELRGNREGWRTSLVIPGCSAAAALIITSLSGAPNDPALCQRLIGVGAPDSVCRGILSFDIVTTTDALVRFLDAFDTAVAVGLIGAFAVVILPLHLFLSANTTAAAQAWRITGIVCAVIAMSFPLFVLGRDWGRWISSHVVLSTIMCIVFLRNRESAGPNPPPTTAGSGALLSGLFVACAMFLWNIRHCCEHEYFVALGPVERLWSLLH